LPAFDTSSIIHAWDHYPSTQFPKLWAWLGGEFSSGRFVMSKIADDETRKRDANCHKWLNSNGVQILPVTATILNHALQIKGSLGITHDRDYRDGVGENDLIIIGTCMEHAIELVTNENRQNQLPQNRAKYKIPAVCALNTVNVQYVNFRDLLVRSGQVF
jgi:predicted nucleic acid-binding protein